jgi:hypothetical protein
MGFRKPDLNPAYHAISSSLIEIKSPYNDGFTGISCKHELYLLKCYLEDAYKTLPKFTGEDEWEQERLMTILKK